MNNSASRTGTDGSRSLGLRMNALPHASAGPAFHSGIIAGKLNGVMPATTPSGWRSEYTSMPVPAPSVYSPLSRCGMPTANSITSMPRWMSPLESATVLPCSSDSSFGQFVDVLVDQVDELHHHPGPALRIPGGPLLLRLGRAGDRGVDVGGRGHRHLGLYLPGVGVHHVGGARRLSGGALAVDEMGNLCGHELAPRQEWLNTWIS